ncbi:MAG: hypothetical protein KAR44_11805 [Candidatus Aegiribacteria sp.]|nr:hypothetical protein [Candidatus Aegiribacteria sp.]
MKPRLVILDADVVIHLNEIGKWDAILESYDIILPEIVAMQEADYFDDGTGCNKTIPIQSCIEKGIIQIEHADQSEIISIQEKLGSTFEANFDVHIGELEAMAVLIRYNTPETAICTGDTAAVIALCWLDLSERIVSLESLLARCGHTASVRRNFSEEALKVKIKRASVFKIQFGT